MDSNIGLEVRRLLTKELGNLGIKTLNEQCDELGIKPELLKPNDLALISSRMARALRSHVGDEKAQKVGKDIQKIKLLSELGALGRNDPGYERRLLDIHSRIASLCYSANDWDEAFEHYEKVRRLCKKLGDDLKLGEAYNAIGYIHVSRSDWDEALKYFELSHELAVKINRPLGMAEAQRGLGYVNWRISKYEKALEYLSQAMEFANTSEDSRTQGLVNLEMGLVYNEMGELSKGLEYFTASLGYFQEINDYEQMARAYNNIGDTHMTKKEWEKALEYLDFCMEIAEKYNIIKFKGWCKMNKSECLSGLNRPDEAIPELEQALELFESIEDVMGICYVYRNFGLANRLLKNYDLALEYFEKSEKINDMLKSPFNSALLYLDWGYLYRDMGKKADAKKMITKATDIFRDVDASHWLEQAENALSKI